MAFYDNQIIGHVSAVQSHDFIVWYRQDSVVTRVFFNDEENCAYEEEDTKEGMDKEIKTLCSTTLWNTSHSAPRFPTLYHSR